MVRLIALVLVTTAGLSAQVIEHYELRKGPGATEGNLIVVVKGRELRVSNRAIEVWPAWVATKLLFSQQAVAADGSPVQEQELRIYDAPSTTSKTLTVEKGSITAVTHVLLGGGDIGFVISVLDSERVPWVVLANDKVGVYRRERLAAPGAITNDSVELRHFNPEDLTRANGEIAKIPPSRMSRVRLLPGDPSPIGNWVATLTAAGGASRSVSLTLYPGGVAKLVVVDGKGQVTRSGAWSQFESDLSVLFDAPEGREPDSPMRWELKPNEMTPKVWNTEEYGSVGLPLKRSSAPWTQR
jgi:hypothetical protein